MKVSFLRTLPVLFALLRGATAFADPPPGYYDSANGLTGPALKRALNEVIKNGHVAIPYDGIFGPLRAIWADPANASNILLFYSSVSISRNSNTWNREHLWPRSRGVSTDGGPDDSDLFHVVPCDADVNGARSNLYFDLSSAADGGIVNPAHAEAPLCTRDGNSWQVQPSQRGDVARALFYMATRYDGRDPGTTDLELSTPSPGVSQMANLDTLLAWHAADPVDAAERARNDLIFSAYQHNRNPFIDRPEWVAAIWGASGAGQTVQAQATDVSAVESPNSTGVFLIQLGTAAPAGGFGVSFAMTGTASAADYALAPNNNETLTFNPGARTGMLVIPPGSTRGSIVITAANDGVPEPAEFAELTVTPGAGYAAIGGTAIVTITDRPPPPPPGVIATWDFNAAAFNDPITATSGAGSVLLDEWTGAVDSFSGAIGQSLALIGSAGNGSHIDIEFSALGFRDLSVTFFTRGTGTGFNSGTWSWSPDGVNFTTLPGVNTATRNTSFDDVGEQLVDFSGASALNHAANVTLRYTLDGASSGSGNNRIDEMAIHASPIPRVSVAPGIALAAERDASPATFVIASDAPAGETGTLVNFQTGGTASSGADYVLGGAASYSAATGAGTVLIPAGETAATLTATPIADADATEFDESVTVQIGASADLKYFAGIGGSALVTIRDDTPYSSAWAARHPGFRGAPAADTDGDGLANFAESFFDLSPLAGDSVVLTRAGAELLPDPNDGNAMKLFATFRYLRRTDTAVQDQAEVALALGSWTNDVVLVSATPGTEPMTEIVKWRGTLPVEGAGAAAEQFFRVRLTVP